MYRLKSWREARLSIVIFAIPLLFALYGLLRHGPAHMVTASHASMEWMATRGQIGRAHV